MKKILLFILFFRTISVFSQEFVTEFKVWNDLYSFQATCNCSIHETHSYFLLGDSIIQGKEYKIMFDSTYRTNSYQDYIELTKKGYLREDFSQQQIFYIENGQTSENKIYDFNLDVSSSITIGLDIYTVKSIDSVDFLGVKRKVLYFSEDRESGLSWISGIGSNKGFFYYQFQGGLLLCVKDNERIIYKNTDDYDCVYFDYISFINEPNTNSLNIYPNPTKTEFVIEKNEVIGEIFIYNSMGVVVKTIFTKNSQTLIDFENFKNGLYFVKIGDEKVKLIKK